MLLGLIPSDHVERFIGIHLELAQGVVVLEDVLDELTHDDLGFVLGCSEDDPFLGKGTDSQENGHRYNVGLSVLGITIELDTRVLLLVDSTKELGLSGCHIERLSMVVLEESLYDVVGFLVLFIHLLIRNQRHAIREIPHGNHGIRK